MIAFILALLQAPAAPPNLPISAAKPLVDYMQCLLPEDRLSVVPAAPADREALFASIVAGCAEVRRKTASAVEAALTAETGLENPLRRREALDAWFGHLEGVLRNLVVDRERSLAAAAAYEACLDRGDQNC